MDPEDVAPASTFPWSVFAVAGATAGGAAFALNLLLGWLLAVPPLPEAGAPLVADAGATSPFGGEPAAPRALSSAEYFQDINGRNIFDHSKIGVTPEGIEGGGGGPAVVDLKVVLKGTIVAEPAELSAAFIQEQGKNSAWAYGIGQTVQGAEILEILDDRVKMLVNGAEQWLMLGEGEVRASTTPTTTTTATPVSETEGVRQLSETSFEVDRALIDAKLADPGALAREARALLHRGPDGEYDGYRLSAIRRGSLADSLGIRNGDIIHNVNGLELNSLDGAMKALEALRSESGLKFEVTRRGQPVTLDYSVK